MSECKIGCWFPFDNALDIQSDLDTSILINWNCQSHGNHQIKDPCAHLSWPLPHVLHSLQLRNCLLSWGNFKMKYVRVWFINSLPLYIYAYRACSMPKNLAHFDPGRNYGVQTAPCMFGFKYQVLYQICIDDHDKLLYKQTTSRYYDYAYSFIHHDPRGC